MEQNNILNYTMKCLMDESIKLAIVESGFSDIELGHKLNVSRTTIHSWRTKDNYKIRSANIVALGKLLNRIPTFLDGSVAFEPITEMEQEMITDVEQQLEDLRNDKIILNELIKTKNAQIEVLTKHIAKIKEEFKTLTESVSTFQNLPQLDHTELQIITNVATHAYHSVSTAYARLLGYSPIEMMQSNFSWAKVIHPDDHFKFSIIEEYFKTRGEVPTTEDTPTEPFRVWKLISKDHKIIYVKSHTIAVGKNFSYVVMQKTSKKNHDQEIADYNQRLMSE